MNAVLRAVETLKIPPRELLFVSGIGCAAWIPSPNFNADTLHTLHGRAVAFAVGAKSFNPKLNVIVISGDGDIASIGGNHLIHAARRNDDITVICASNENYGMTGGQTGPTTRLGGLTATHPAGNPYKPFDLVHLVLAAGAQYAARYTVTQPRALSNAIERAVSTKGFCFIETISPCPTQFGRRNRFDQIDKLYDDLVSRYITRQEAHKMDPKDTVEKIVTGEWFRGEVMP